MFKSLLFVFVLYSSIFAEENITGLFGLKLGHQYNESGNNVLKMINKEEETITFVKKNVPEPFFFFFELPDINNYNYFIKTYKNKTILISGSFSEGNVSQEKINHMIGKINLLQDYISKKYNVSKSDFLYLKNDKGIPSFPTTLSMLNGNGLFQTDNDFKIYFLKNNVKYTIIFSYTKDIINFEINVENVLDKEEIEKLLRNKIMNAI